MIAAASIWSRRRCTTGRIRVPGRTRAPRCQRARGAGEIEEVRAFGLIELERPPQRFEHELGDAADMAALQTPVVVDTDAGEGGDLLSTQPGNAALAVARQADLLGRDLRPAAGEELGDVVGSVHAGLPCLIALRQAGGGRDPTIDRLESRSGAFLVPLSEAPSTRLVVGHPGSGHEPLREARARIRNRRSA